MARPDGLVVVGGGPAGHAAAKAYRDAGGRGRLALLTAEDRPPYRRPPLTKEFLRGEAGEDDLPLAPAGWYEANGIELRLRAPVRELDPGRRELRVGEGDRLAYGDCVLCTGSEPVRPPLPGARDPRTHVLRTVADARRLAAAAGPGTRVAVVGSGFIGCEAAASLALRGARVTVVTPEAAPQAERLGAEVGALIRTWLEELGVAVRAGEEVEGIEHASDGRAVVRTPPASALPVDEVVLGTGARPRTALAEAAGLDLVSGGVPTDASMRTAIDGLWCAGDLAVAHNDAADRRLRVEHWGEALAHGEAAGSTLAGRERRWASAPGFWSTIGRCTLKQVAWGDGWDATRLDGGTAGFTAWYGRDGRVVGVLTHGRDADDERGRALVEAGAPWPP